MLEVTITNEEKITVALNPSTRTNKPVRVDGVPVWSVVSGNSTIIPAADGLSAELTSEDATGDTEFKVVADADRGAGVENIIDTVLLHVVDAKATSLGLSAGDPVAK